MRCSCADTDYLEKNIKKDGFCRSHKHFIREATARETCLYVFVVVLRYCTTTGHVPGGELKPNVLTQYNLLLHMCLYENPFIPWKISKLPNLRCDI